MHTCSLTSHRATWHTVLLFYFFKPNTFGAAAIAVHMGLICLKMDCSLSRYTTLSDPEPFCFQSWLCCCLYRLHLEQCALFSVEKILRSEITLSKATDFYNSNSYFIPLGKARESLFKNQTWKPCHIMAYKLGPGHLSWELQRTPLPTRFPCGPSLSSEWAEI